MAKINEEPSSGVYEERQGPTIFAPSKTTTGPQAPMSESPETRTGPNGTMPRVSIIVTCYNLGAYLQEALDSVAAYPDRSHYEVILVDDGSTDPATIAMIAT